MCRTPTSAKLSCFHRLLFLLLRREPWSPGLLPACFTQKERILGLLGLPTKIVVIWPRRTEIWGELDSNNQDSEGVTGDPLVEMNTPFVNLLQHSSSPKLFPITAPQQKTRVWPRHARGNQQGCILHMASKVGTLLGLNFPPHDRNATPSHGSLPSPALQPLTPPHPQGFLGTGCISPRRTFPQKVFPGQPQERN